uniref:Macrophage-expressed gene 1 protein n=1 Tax=Panagrolaimus sp. ES5 TaxID=591445 RepID=A0AC34FLM0_9BILA
MINLSSVITVLIGFGISAGQNLSDVDQCLSFVQENLRHKNMSRTLGGLVGLGWDDLTNEYTLPILALTYKQCRSDPDNQWLIPDNVVMIPIKNTALDRTSSTFNSFDEYMSSNSNKLTITGSASVKGKGSVSASFSKENSDSKHEFVKVDSIMLQNKLTFLAFDLIANEHGSMDQAFIRRIKEIASAVKEGNKMKAQFLAEVLVADYGTHVINKATAAAEIIQETYINKKEEFKGETHMNAIKVGVSGEFDGQAYGGGGSVGVENKKESGKNESTTTTTTRSLINTHGGPHINRMGTPNINDSMIHVDNLVGINQKGKLIYDIIPAVPLPEFSRMIKYTVKELIYNAVQTYYKYNSLPGCMQMDSESYNPLYCWNEEVDVKVLDEIYTATYWCMSSKDITEEKVEDPKNNSLELIMHRPILSAIDKIPKLLEACFPTSFDLKTLLENEEVCKTLPKDETTDAKTQTWKTVKDNFIHSSIRQICSSSCPKNYLNITSQQLEVLKDYPNLLEALLPLLELRRDIRSHPELFKNSAMNPLVLQQVVFNEKQSFQHKEKVNEAFFGGFFQNNNNNPFTGKSECPPYFEEIDILENLKICICYDTDRKWPIRLGKIFHCSSDEKWCPKGYSEFLAGTIKNCDYNYCIRFHTRDEISPPVVNKPPFIDYKNATAEKTI